MNLKVSKGEEFYLDGALKAIKYAADNGAHILSNSWGGPYDRFMEEVIKYAYQKGCIIVAAAGNEGSDNVGYPAGFPEVICVSATDHNDKVPNWSNYGVAIDVAAPGGEEGDDHFALSILSLRADNLDPFASQFGEGVCVVGEKYYRAAGTSMSCPMVAGVCALILSKHPSFKQEEVRAALCMGAEDLGDAGWDPYYGNCRVNAYNSILIKEPPLLEVNISSPTSYQRVKGRIKIKGTAKGRGFTSWMLEYGVGRVPEEWRVIGSGGSPVEDSVLYELDTKTLNEGLVAIRLTAKAGRYKRGITVVFSVENKVEEGDFPFVLADTMMPPEDAPYMTTLNPPLVIDVTGDGKDEIVAPVGKWNILYENDVPESVVVLHVLTSTGEEVAGFPAYSRYGHFTTSTYSSPSAGDIDNDGKVEILLPIMTIDSEKEKPITRIYIWNNDGSIATIIQLPAGVTPAFSPIVLEDLDKDKDLEIILGVSISNTTKGGVYIYDHEGKEVTHWEVKLDTNFVELIPEGELDLHFYKTIYLAVGDIDNNGEVEIVGVTYDSKVYAWKRDGSLLPNFPTQKLIPLEPIPEGLLPGIETHPLALADLDNDKDLEIIVAYSYGVDGGVAVFHHTGEKMEGWPKEGLECVKYPTIGDLDGDGDLEIVVTTGTPTYYFGSENNRIYAFHHTGEYVEGFDPCRLPTVANMNSPVIADITGDGVPEIIISGGGGESPLVKEKDPLAGKLYVYNNQGKVVDGFPWIYEHPFLTITVGDVDKDKKVELIISPQEACFFPRIVDKLGGEVGVLYVYELAQFHPKTMYWTTIFHDPQRTSRFEVPKVGIEEELNVNRIVLEIIPNPFISGEVVINYILPRGVSSFCFSIYDITGREV
jgi:hypothetical protein